MLAARPTKRDATNRFSRDVRYDIDEAEAAIGALVYDIKSESATLTVRGQAFTAARERARRDEALCQAALRKLSGGEKPPANPVALREAGGAVLARAESKGAAGRLIARGEEAFELRRRSALSRLYDLYRQGQGEALGSAGPRKFFAARLHADLPSEFDAPFQVFAVALHTDLTFVELAKTQN